MDYFSGYQSGCRDAQVVTSDDNLKDLPGVVSGVVCSLGAYRLNWYLFKYKRQRLARTEEILEHQPSRVLLRTIQIRMRFIPSLS